MGMSTHVIGIVPPDETWKKMKAIWDACTAAKIEIPEAVDAFFGGVRPEEKGVVVDIEDKWQSGGKQAGTGAAHEWRGTDSAFDAREGYEVNLDELREKFPHVKIIRFYNSY